jgi:hypothetical protein
MIARTIATIQWLPWRSGDIHHRQTAAAAPAGQESRQQGSPTPPRFTAAELGRASRFQRRIRRAAKTSHRGPFSPARLAMGTATYRAGICLDV